jgi:hypothetical protein
VVIDGLQEYDESPSEDEADPIDAMLENADWPKRSKDTQEDIEASIAARGEQTPFIGGSGWFAWLDYDSMDWESDEPEVAPLGMIREGFRKETIDEYIESDKTRVELYGDVVSFLSKWGIKARVVS